MMGGAVVATGQDEATPFINPAGITSIPGRSFSFSTFVLTATNRTVESSLDASNRLHLDGTDVNRFRLRVLPNTFCFFLDGPPKSEKSPRSRHKYALCGGATEREQLDFTRANRDGDGASFSSANHATNLKFVRSTVAASWGLSLSRDTSIGVTFRTDNTRLRDDTSATAYQGGGGVGRLQSLSHSIKAWSWDTSVLVGLTSSLSRHVTLGASLTTPSQHLLGRFTGVSATSSTSGLPHTMNQDTGDFRYNKPASLRLGLGFLWPRLVVEVDGSFYGPQRQLARANLDRTQTTVQGTGIVQDELLGQGRTHRASIVERGAPVTNLSAGAEYFLQSNFSLIAGVQTDFSALHPRQDSTPTDVLFRQQKDSYFAALGVTTYGEGGRLQLGLRGHHARGTILIADPSLQQPQFVALPQTEWSVSLVVSGQIQVSMLQDAARKATRPLTQRPRGEHAEDDE